MTVEGCGVGSAGPSQNSHEVVLLTHSSASTALCSRAFTTSATISVQLPCRRTVTLSPMMSNYAERTLSRCALSVLSRCSLAALSLQPRAAHSLSSLSRCSLAARAQLVRYDSDAILMIQLVRFSYTAYTPYTPPSGFGLVWGAAPHVQ